MLTILVGSLNQSYCWPPEKRQYCYPSRSTINYYSSGVSSRSCCRNVSRFPNVARIKLHYNSYGLISERRCPVSKSSAIRSEIGRLFSNTRRLIIVRCVRKSNTGVRLCAVTCRSFPLPRLTVRQTPEKN